jgi:hypothetical protein
VNVAPSAARLQPSTTTAATVASPVATAATANAVSTSAAVEVMSGQVAPIGPFPTGARGSSNAVITAPTVLSTTAQTTQLPNSAATGPLANVARMLPSTAPAVAIRSPRSNSIGR